MKKILVGSIVGGLIIFIWQFLSFAAINFHQPSQQYTDKEDAILEFFKSQGLEEGGYVIPSAPEGMSMKEHEAKMESEIGKPWATIQYHSELKNNMIMNMIRCLIVNIIAVYFFCWFIRRMNAPTFSGIFTGALVLGLIIFLNAPYINHIWYDTFDIWAYLLDYVVSWGLVGLWLGWYLTRNNAHSNGVRLEERKVEIAD